MKQDDEKQLAAAAALDLIEEGMVVGLGTGSTASIFVKLLAARVKKGLKIKGIATSDATARLAQDLGIPLVSLDANKPDIDIDGADEVARSLCLIKGGGGALLREKIVAYAASRFIVVVDSMKLVDRLGAFRVPIEIIPFAHGVVVESVADLGGKPALRSGKNGGVFTTDQGNWIIDCDFGLLDAPEVLALRLSQIPGIVEHGLFINMVDTVLVGRDDQVQLLKKP